MEQIKIQPITSDDFDENIKLHNQEISHSHWMARKRPISREEMRNFLDFLHDQPDSIYLVAKYEDQLVGNIYALPRTEDLLNHISLLSYQVHPEYQRRGIGTLLMESLLQKIRDENSNIQILFAEVLQENIASIKLLKKFSFSPAGILPEGVRISPQQYDNLLFFYRRIEVTFKRN
ncbi:MAG: GNAT family N-acetyltransferase [Promethearchaeota archaeon]